MHLQECNVICARHSPDSDQLVVHFVVAIHGACHEVDQDVCLSVQNTAYVNSCSPCPQANCVVVGCIFSGPVTYVKRYGLKAIL